MTWWSGGRIPKIRPIYVKAWRRNPGMAICFFQHLDLEPLPATAEQRIMREVAFHCSLSRAHYPEPREAVNAPEVLSDE